MRFNGVTLNPVINLDASITTPEPSPLREDNDFSCRFMEHPDDTEEPGVAYRGPLAQGDALWAKQTIAQLTDEAHCKSQSYRQ